MAKQASDEFRALVADAMTHFQAGRPAEAESAYRAALAIIPADPAVTHNLGVAIAAQGRHRDAVGCFDEALRADPGFVSAHYNRGVALMRLGETPGGDQGLRPRRAASNRSITKPIAHWASSGWRKASAGGRSIIWRAPTSCGAAMTGPPSRANR